jgi:hypothetical protein
MKLPNPQDTSTEDQFLRNIKGVLAAIPAIGGVLSELFDQYLPSLHKKKMEEWFKYIEETVQVLVTQETISKEELLSDPEIGSLIIKTSKKYLENVEKIKEQIFKAYFTATISKKTPLDKKLIFLEIIDRLTEKHIAILQEIFQNEQSNNYLHQSELEAKLIEKYTEGDKSYFDLIIEGLQDFHLLTYFTCPEREIINDARAWHMDTSKIAKELVEYLKIE